MSDRVADILSAYEPTLRQRIGDATYDVARYLGMDSIANRMRGDVRAAVDFIPGVGDAVGIDEAARDYQAGNYTGAAVNAGASAVGAIPVGGDLAAGALKAIFGGVAASTAKKDMLEAAMEMAESGADRSQIFSQTGWFKGLDGRWRFEIDDSASYYDPTAIEDLKWSSLDEGRPFDPLRETTTVGGAMGHSKLYEAYPGVSDVPVHYFPQDRMRGANAAYSPNLDRVTISESLDEDTARSFMLHELQHAIQAREGFESGGNTIDDAYRRLAGEVEARNVQTRMNMTPEQRIATPPWETEDVPIELQIIRNKIK